MQAQPAADGEDAIADALQADAGGPVGEVEAAAVVVDAEQDAVGTDANAQAYARGVRMARGIGRGFLCDAVKRRLRAVVETVESAFGVVDAHIERDAGGIEQTADGAFAQCVGEAEIVEAGGAQAGQQSRHGPAHARKAPRRARLRDQGRGDRRTGDGVARNLRGETVSQP